MNRILFLDIDGVLATQDSYKRAWEDCKRSYETTGDRNMALVLDDALIARLNHITDTAKAVIVISSSWRHLASIDKLRQMLKSRGITAEIIGETPSRVRGQRFSEHVIRGREIQEWINDHRDEIESFAIVDDDQDMTHAQQARFVRTNGDVGLTDDDVQRIITLLATPMERTMSIPKNVRINYIPDTENADRTLTIAHRRNEDNTITFGVSINRPTEWVEQTRATYIRSFYKTDGDKFNKKKGREIALGRLESARFEREEAKKQATAGTIPLPDGMSPLMACLDHLSATSEHKHIQRVATNEAAFLRWMEETSQILDEKDEQRRDAGFDHGAEEDDGA